MVFYVLYHHEKAWRQVKECEAIGLLIELDLVTPAIMAIIAGEVVTTSKAQIKGWLKSLYYQPALMQTVKE